MSDTKNPPEGKARAYVIRGGINAGKIAIWNGSRYVARGILTLEAQIRSTDVPIPEWKEVKWDAGCPEYVVLPAISNTTENLWAYERGNWALKVPSLRPTGAWDPDAVYKRHESHPEIGVRVWEREKMDGLPARGRVGSGPMAISDVNWSHVHRGELVPPSRVVVPKEVLTNKPAWAFLCVYGRDAFSMPVGFACGSRIAGQHHAANYSLGGHLIGHRTKGGGWKEVSPDATSLPSGDGALGKVPPRDCNSGRGSEAPECTSAGEKPALTDDPERYVHGYRPHGWTRGDAAAFDARQYSERAEQLRGIHDSLRMSASQQLGAPDRRVVTDPEVDRAQLIRGELDRRKRDAGL